MFIMDVLATLDGVRRGDRAASDRLFAHVYARLREVGAVHLRREGPGHTLQPTALVHEAYLDLCGHKGLELGDRAHFISVAARAMRRVLVQHARAKKTEKRGGDQARVTFGDDLAAVDFDLLELDSALEKLELRSERVARGVVLRFFGGLSSEEVAEVLGVSVRTVGDDWRTAKIWLKRELG